MREYDTESALNASGPEELESNGRQDLEIYLMDRNKYPLGLKKETTPGMKSPFWRSLWST